jgi:RepB DNA-primase N-terminal domain
MNRNLHIDDVQHSHDHRFMSLICGEDQYNHYRAIDKNNNVKKLYGSYTLIRDQLMELNHRSFNIFLTINKANEQGAKTENIEAIRAIFLDFDNPDLDGLKVINSFPIKPTMVVNTSPNKYHAYFVLKEPDPRVALFKPIQLQLAERFNSDKAIIDLPRIMRIPNFLHCKEVPYLSKIVDLNTNRYCLDEIVQAFDLNVVNTNQFIPLSSNNSNFYDTEINRRKYVKKLKEIVADGKHVAIDGQNGNDAIVNHVAPFARDYGLSPQVALQLVWGHYNPHCLPPWSENEKVELFKLIERGYRAAKNELGCRATEPATVAFLRAPPVREPIEGWENNRIINNHRKKGAKSISSESVSLAHLIERQILQTAEIEIHINRNVIDKMLSACFYNSGKNSFYLLSENHQLIEARNDQKWAFLKKTFGSPIDSEILTRKLENKAKELRLNRAETNKFIKETSIIPRNFIIEHISYFNQKTSLYCSVDMFASSGRIELDTERAKVFFVHKKLKQEYFDNLVIQDYKSHFPLFDDFIEWLVYSRFASDRKLAFLWLHAESDWGKGFLLSVLGRHDLVVEVSAKEVEKMFEGAPVGRSRVDFDRAMVLAVDEFKSVKSEFKQLQNQMVISPKNQLSVQVNLYAKIFTSAEHVNSLVGDAGIEDQFANRFNYIRCKGSLNDRPLFSSLGKAAYICSVQNYFAHKFNQLVKTLKSYGYEKSTELSDLYLIEFHKKYGIDNEFNRLSESLPQITNEIKEWLISTNDLRYLVTYLKKRYLKSPDTAISAYIEQCYDHSNKLMLNRKKSEIKALLCVDGEGYKARSLNSKTIKAIRIV